MEFICWYENVAFKQNSAALGSKFPGFVANLQADTSTHWAEPYSRPPQANCQLTAHDYATLITVTQLSIWRPRQQGCICEADSFIRSLRWEMDLLASTRETMIQGEEWRTRGGSVYLLTWGSLCHLNSCDPQGPNITLWKKTHTHKTRSVSNHHMLTVTQTLHKLNSCNRFQYIIVLVVSRLRTGGRR